MAKQFKLTVEKRDLKGNKDLRQLRKDMKIPGVYYSYDGSNILFQESEEVNTSYERRMVKSKRSTDYRT